LQRFLDDMIQVVLSSNRHPSQFIALSERHKQSLYYLFHECHANGKGLTQPLIEWFRRGLDFMSGSIRNEQGKPILVNLEGLLASNPELAPKILNEIDHTAKFMLWNKARYEISLRANLMDDKLNVDVDGLLRALMESEGEEVEQRNASSNSFGMVDWGYFYDPQVIDNATQTILEGEPQPGNMDVDSDSTYGGSSTQMGASKFKAHVPVHNRQSSPFIKPPALSETRKLVDAYLRQIAPALNNAADHEQWPANTKHKT